MLLAEKLREIGIVVQFYQSNINVKFKTFKQRKLLKKVEKEF